MAHSGRGRMVGLEEGDGISQVEEGGSSSTLDLLLAMTHKVSPNYQELSKRRRLEVLHSGSRSPFG